MRVLIASLVFLIFSGLVGGASALAADGDAALTASSGVDPILDALHEVGRELRNFTAQVVLTETDLISADSFSRDGRVWYQKKGEGDARLHVVFDTRTTGEDKPVNEKVEYALDKGWLVDRNYKKRIEVNRQVLRPGEKINLLKLGEGPFPLPIGQKKEDVLRLFNVSKIAGKSTDPAGTVHLQLTPKAGTQFERKFSQIDVWVDLSTHFPRRIETLDKNQTTSRTTDLSKIEVNGAVKDSDFSLPAINEGEWQRHDEPFAE